MKITESIVNFALKKGLLGDINNFETEIELPNADNKLIKVTIKAEHIEIKVKGD